MTKNSHTEIVCVQVGCVYVFSSDDLEAIHDLLPASGDHLWELAESRKVEFPNPFFRGNLKEAKEFRDQFQMDLFEQVASC